MREHIAAFEAKHQTDADGVLNTALLMLRSVMLTAMIDRARDRKRLYDEIGAMHEECVKELTAILAMPDEVQIVKLEAPITPARSQVETETEAPEGK